MKPLDLLSKVINSTYELQEKENMWTNSRFEKVNKLKNDYSGKAGELFLKDLCESIKIKYHYDEEVCWNAKHPQLGNTPHLRRETTDVYKWDFSQAVLKRARKADYCLKMDDKTSFREIKSFFQRRNVI